MARRAPEVGAFPVFGDGRRMKVGLLGGSFDPAHEGHQRLAAYALKHLRLDQVWLLVTPGNPFKKHQGSEAFEARLRSAQRISDGRRIVATDIEAQLGTKFTAETLTMLRRRYPHITFVWIMGADSFASLTRWNHWRKIIQMVAIAVVPRPGQTRGALLGKTAQRLRRLRKQARFAPILAQLGAPGWAFLMTPHSGISSTDLRRSASRNGTLSTYYRLEYEPIPTKPSTRLKSAASLPSREPQDEASLHIASTDARQTSDKTSRKKRISAGPEKKARSRTAAMAADTDILMEVIHESLIADKAEDITIIDLIGRASFADKMVIATGLADRQIAAMAEHIEKKLKESGVKRVWIEGEGGSDWVLLDAGDIVVHLFKAEARQHYALEKMWAPELDDDTDN